MWTAAETARAIELTNAGLSRAEVAKDLGKTRNAVVGRLHRLGLSVPMEELSPEAKAARKERRREQNRLYQIQRRLRFGPRIRDPYRRKKLEAPPIVDHDIPVEQRKSFLELTSRCCHWPVNDPDSSDFFFCGAPAYEKKPYCIAHCARAYRGNGRLVTDPAIIEMRRRQFREAA